MLWSLTSFHSATALALVFLRKVGIIEQTPPELQDSDDDTGAKEQHQK